MSLPDFASSIAAYEDGLAARFGPALHRESFAVKRTKMREDPFLFLRATCWRFAEAAPSLCSDLMNAPAVGSVGDAHAGNFGLWRDAQFRLVWGVDDYDEAARLPYPLDLVRLGASLLLADDSAGASDLARCMLEAYSEALDAPEPFVVEDRHMWLRELFEIGHDQRTKFWRKLREAEPAIIAPAHFGAPLLDALPGGCDDITIAPRLAGVGSLGRPRFVALGTFRGGPVAAEIKGMIPSCWTAGREAGLARRLAEGPYRSPDPTLAYHDDHALRRLAPNSRKLGFDEIERALKPKLIAAMAADLAAIHAGAGDVGAIHHDLAARPNGWLAEASQRVAAWTKEEWCSFRRAG